MTDSPADTRNRVFDACGSLEFLRVMQIRLEFRLTSHAEVAFSLPFSNCWSCSTELLREDVVRDGNWLTKCSLLFDDNKWPEWHEEVFARTFGQINQLPGFRWLEFEEFAICYSFDFYSLFVLRTIPNILSRLLLLVGRATWFLYYSVGSCYD